MSCCRNCGLLRSQLEEALAELVALGLVTSDSFDGLRALLVPSSERKADRRPPGVAAAPYRPAWRTQAAWSLVRQPPAGGGAQAQCRRDRACGPRAARVAMAWCSGECWNGNRHGCRRGASCCVSIDDLRAAVKFAAGALWRASLASNSPCPRRSHAARGAPPSRDG